MYNLTCFSYGWGEFGFGDKDLRVNTLSRLKEKYWRKETVLRTC